MNSKKSARLSNSFLALAAILILSSCNPYRLVVRDKTPTIAAEQIIERLEKSYPFTGHKGIRWNEYKEPIQEILSQNWNDSLYRQTKELFFRIPDTRFNISGDRDEHLINEDVAGYLGFELSRDHEGLCRVIYTDSSSLAWEKGLRPGNQILGWNAQSIHSELQNQTLIWGLHPASEALRIVLQNHFMTRGKPSESVEVFFETSTGNTRGIRIPYERSDIQFTPDYIGIPKYSDTYPTFQIVGKTGVLTIREFDLSFFKTFQNKISLQLSELDNLIVDLRETTGGVDDLAAGLASWFVTTEKLYEESLLWNEKTNEWLELSHIHVQPNADGTFDKPTILLIGPKCNGAGEGFARVLDMEDHVTTLGMWSTAGSFSFPGGQIRVKDKFTIHYPIGMSVDHDGAILIESPGDYGGGIYPDIRVSDNYPNLIALSYGQDILLEEALRRLSR